MFVGYYRGVRIDVDKGDFVFLFGWVPQRKQSLRAAKVAITKWRKQA